jgi:hypothetical protein
MTKSYLRLVKEFQGRSYDSMVAHTTIVFIRYIMLSIESRCCKDPRTIGKLFFTCCDEMEDITLVESVRLIMSLLMDALSTQLHLEEDEINIFF